MLTKKDLEQIEKVVANRIDTAFADFYDHIFEPFATRMEENKVENQRQHAEIVSEIKKIQKRDDEQDEYIKEHDNRISELEKAVKIKN